MDAGILSRREAVFVLARWIETGDFPDRLLTDSPDRGFVMDLVYGAVRWRRALEWALAQLMKRPPGGETQAALLAGAYQVLFMEDVPAYAAVHATVEAAKIASGRAAGLVNGVLRNLVRRRAELLDALAKQPAGVRLSHPDALIVRWTDRYGAEKTEALCRWNNTPAETVLARLPQGSVPCSVSSVQGDETIATERRTLNTEHLAPHPAAPDACLVLPHGTRVERVEGFAEGQFVVQDPSTLMSVEMLDVRPGMAVLDACAAPGGKTAQLAARLRGQGRLVALDLHADRLATLRATLARTRQEWVEVRQADASQPLPDDLPRFDRILLDAPCSNTGVLRRRPGARWRFSSQRLRRLCATQRSLLANLLGHLAPGGRLVYSTCSLEPEENRQVVEAVLAEHPGFQLAVTAARFPPRHQTDGAFAAAISRG
jgi:16S rRNA (cytosine967-C5)-methyltransferase